MSRRKIAAVLAAAVVQAGCLLELLSRGYRGDDVRAVQEALVEANFYPDINALNALNNGVDGIYGRILVKNSKKLFKRINQTTVVYDDKLRMYVRRDGSMQRLSLIFLF
ncbi:hypothetical protein EPH95_15985 [Salicibibacter halophilus]|uniref:Uncharacterized protein n=1 Tax=Salicibibacter halophilus TaxID=2502791 RepID=A0A514LL29_9BACI|nr:hypothetical protein [Salicibibacter halophilus]QDI92503.1 hypothetical protein EPH95_15985 [Salicibibacter halophilus]